MLESLYLSFILYILSLPTFTDIVFTCLTVMAGLNYFPWKLNLLIQVDWNVTAALWVNVFVRCD